MELFQDISSKTINELLLPYSSRNMDEPGSADWRNGAFSKQIIVGGTIGATFITLVGAHWMLLQIENMEEKYAFVKPATSLEKFSLSFDTTTELPLKINRNIGKTRSFNE